MEGRITSRGGRVPNYREDGEHFGSDFGDDLMEKGKMHTYYIDPENIEIGDDHEIEAVLSHQRDETRLDDPDDIWTENIVRSTISNIYSAY